MDTGDIELGADFRVYRQTGKVTFGTEPCMLMIDEEVVLVWIMQAVVCWNIYLEQLRHKLGFT